MWQIGRQVRLEEGEEAPRSPGDTGPRLDICCEVKWRLARAANLSCHSSWWLQNAHLSRSSKSGGWAANTTGQRSRFLLRWGWIPSGPLAQASICQSIPPPLRSYLLGTCCSLCCLQKHVLACLCLPHTEGGPLCGGGTGVLSPTDSEGLSAPVQDLHSVKKSCFDTSSNVIGFNWRHQHPTTPPSPKKKENNMEKFDQQCREVEHRRVGGLRKGRKNTAVASITHFLDKGRQKLRLWCTYLTKFDI